MTQKLKADDYEIDYDPENHIVICKGSLELSGTDEYRPFADMLNKAVDDYPAELTLDLRELVFLNSSGINIISKFVIALRQRGQMQLNVLGSRQIPWQGKSLINLQRLLPSVKLDIV